MIPQKNQIATSNTLRFVKTKKAHKNKSHLYWQSGIF